MAPDQFSNLVLRLTPRLKAAPSVTLEQYRAVSCNRCGGCCEDVPAPFSPDELAELLADGALDSDRRQFCSYLEPVEPLTRGWRYRCVHFSRDDQGLGVCAIYERRPQLCRAYPYGGVVRSWPQCAWYVQIRNADGSVLPVAPALTD